MGYKRTNLTIDYSYHELWMYRQTLLKGLTAQEKKEVFPSPVVDFIAFLLACPSVLVRYFLPVMGINILLFALLRGLGWQNYIPVISSIEKIVFLLWLVFLMGKIKLLFDIHRIEDKVIRDEIRAHKIIK